MEKGEDVPCAFNYHELCEHKWRNPLSQSRVIQAENFDDLAKRNHNH